MVPADGGLPRSRYLSFEPNGMKLPAADGDALAIQAIDKDGFLAFGGVRYVGPPSAYPEGALDVPTFWGATLQCDPYIPPEGWDEYAMLHVFGTEIVPGAAYTVHFETTCDVPGLSEPVRIDTGVWGDVVDPIGPNPDFRQPDVLDILAIVDKFLGAPQAPIKARTQLQPEVPDPTRKVDIADVLACVDAFLGKAYPYPIPDLCAP